MICRCFLYILDINFILPSVNFVSGYIQKILVLIEPKSINFCLMLHFRSLCNLIPGLQRYTIFCSVSFLANFHKEGFHIFEVIFIYGIKKECSFIFSFPFYVPVFPRLSVKQCILFLIFIVEHPFIIYQVPTCTPQVYFFNFIKSYNLCMVNYIHLKYIIWWILTDVYISETTTTKIQNIFIIPELPVNPFGFHSTFCPLTLR